MIANHPFERLCGGLRLFAGNQRFAANFFLAIFSPVRIRGTDRTRYKRREQSTEARESRWNVGGNKPGQQRLVVNDFIKTRAPIKVEYRRRVVE